MAQAVARVLAPSRWHHPLVCLCFALSGLAALVYQVAWARQFALVFGTSELAVVAVLAAYMGGLAIGARTVEKLLPRITRPVRLYATLELAIGGAALALVPICLQLAEQLLTALWGGQSSPSSSGMTSTTLFYLCAAFATLLVPTILMGATLPLLVRDSVHDDEQIGIRVGRLYACNTGGAVLGALLTALVLLPSLGLRGTVKCAVAINVLIAGLAWLLQRGEVEQVPSASDSSSARVPTRASWKLRPLGTSWILPMIFLSGAVAFLHEVLWTRMLSRVVGSGIQAFGVMLASFLLGIALGGALGARLARSRASAAHAFAFSQLAVGLTAIAAWYALDYWALLPSQMLERVSFGLIVLLPLTLSIGVSFPLAVRILANDANSASSASARVYAWNTSGAIAGALAGGFLVIPALRFEGALQLAVWISLGIAALGAAMLQGRALRVAIPLAAGVVAALFHPGPPDNLLKASIIRGGKGTIVYYDVGRTADVVVVRDGPILDIRSNGLPEAGTPILGAPRAVIDETWMSTLAVLARPASRTALIVGYGGGNVVDAVPPSISAIDVIELEPKVIEANRAIAAIRSHDPLTDARVNFIYNDARSALSLTDKRYDLVLSQPSHPWTAGASHLYTREFMLQAKRHLNESGLLVQWMGAEFTNASLQRSVLATLLSVFREVRVYRPSGTTLLYLASDAPIQPEHDLQQTRIALDRAPHHYARMSLATPEDLIAALAMETSGAREFASAHVPITDDDNRLAMANLYERKMGMSMSQLSEMLRPFDPLTTPESFVYKDIRDEISFEYLWRRILLWAGGGDESFQRVQRMTEILGDSAQGTLLRYMTNVHQRAPAEAAKILADGLQRWPDSATLRYAEVEVALGQLAPGPTQQSPAVETRWLDAEARSVVEATLAASRQQWAAVAAVDEQLGRVPVTAQWEPQAQRLRAEWRMRVKNPELRQRFGDEGISIADRAEVNYPDADWHALRAFSAAGTNRPEVVVESVAAFCATVAATEAKLDRSERARLLERGRSLERLLGQLNGIVANDRARYDEVRRLVETTLAALT